MTAGGESTAGKDRGAEGAAGGPETGSGTAPETGPESGAESDPAAELARELREARVEAGLSLKELEPLTASSDSSLSRYLSGASVPPWSVVEALLTAARREPNSLAPLWEAAQRSRFERRVRARESGGEQTDQDAAAPVTAGAGDASARGTAVPEAGSAPDIEAKPRVRRRSARLPVLAGVAVGVVAALVAVVVAFLPGHSDPSNELVRLCPWQYIVTDGYPAPVNIANSPNKGRVIIALYQPKQIFYAPDPLKVSNGMQETVDGWVTQGDWIQRYNGPCITVPKTSVATSFGTSVSS